jgi:hypothetical protein
MTSPMEEAVKLGTLAVKRGDRNRLVAALRNAGAERVTAIPEDKLAAFIDEMTPDVEELLRSTTAENLLTTMKVLTHRVHEYDTGLSDDKDRADTYRQQRSEVEAELLRRLGGAHTTG